jgi:protein-S-isoprenylcysteine O-methyltransferase Ste14
MVGAQFLLLAVVLLAPGDEAWTMPGSLRSALRVVAVAGLAPMAVGAMTLGRGLTAAPLPNAHAQLRTGGLYRLVRHPIYSGLLLWSLAWAAASGRLVAVVAAAALVGLINVKARWEEHRLAERFPAYPAYAAGTPRFLPCSRPRWKAPFI